MKVIYMLALLAGCFWVYTSPNPQAEKLRLGIASFFGKSRPVSAPTSEELALKAQIDHLDAKIRTNAVDEQRAKASPRGSLGVSDSLFYSRANQRLEEQRLQLRSRLDQLEMIRLGNNFTPENRDTSVPVYVPAAQMQSGERRVVSRVNGSPVFIQSGGSSSGGGVNRSSTQHSESSLRGAPNTGVQLPR